MTIEINHFSKDQTAILKGLGILLIVLHNFFHNLTPVIGENEFTFSAEIFLNFYQTLQASPENVLRALFSYFGHYGVQVFIFFSSYGLTRKYYQKPLIISQFLANRINKIYFSFLLCVVVYILLGLVKSQLMPGEKCFTGIACFGKFCWYPTLYRGKRLCLWGHGGLCRLFSSCMCYIPGF